MADDLRAGTGLWPGVVGEAHATYTTSHGITPGCVILTINPQPGPFASEGNFVFDDGVNRITLIDCKLSAVKRQGDIREGWVDTLEILDHRWKWNLGAISGTYNLQDDNKKLIGWSIRSPTELALLCLRAMGETNFRINLPPGLDSAVGRLAFELSPPWMGVTPITGTNPPVNWDGEIPAVALSRLCELFGRRVIWRWSDNSILIDVPGRGAELPDGSIASESPSIKSAMVPDGIGIIGSPTRYQAKFLLEPVGEEWHGGLVPINELSYAPLMPARVSIYKVRAVRGVGGPGGALGRVWTLGLSYAGQDPIFGIESTQFTTDVLAADAIVDIVTRIADQIAAHPFWGTAVTATVGDGTDFVWLTITGNDPNADPRARDFNCGTTGGPITFGGYFRAFLEQAGAGERPGWDYCPPPSGFLNGVRAVPGSLTQIEAAELAMKSVWKMFRIKANPDGTLPIQIPAYGPLVRRQQVLLENVKVEQITPPTDFVEDTLRREQALNFYNGYSHCRPLAVYGSVAVLGVEQLLWPGANPPGSNTDPARQILANFSVDPVQQIVYCSDRYCFKWENNRYVDPRLILETGCLIRNAATNALECYVAAKPFPALTAVPTGRDASGVATGFTLDLRTSRTNYAFRTHSDVQVGVIGNYRVVPPIRQVVNVVATNILEPDGSYSIGLAPMGIYPFTAPLETPNVEIFEYTTLPGDTFLEVVTDLADQINSDGTWQMLVRAEVLDGTGGIWMRVTGLVDDPDRFLFFSCAALGPDPDHPMGTRTARRATRAFAGEKLVGYSLLEADPFMRASYYLAGLEASYFQSLALTNRYNGIEAIDLDGAIQQVTWVCDVQSGCSTTASRNTEHDLYVPPYPARRRVEGLIGAARNPYTSGRPGGVPDDVGRNAYTPIPGLSNPYTPVPR